MENNLDRLPFVYVVDLTGIVAGGSATGTIQIQQDSDFEHHYFTATTSLSAAPFNSGGGPPGSGLSPSTLAENNFSVQVQDMATGRFMFSNALKQALFCGNGFNNILTGCPVRFIKNSQVLVTVNNLTGVFTAGQSAGVTIAVSIAMNGFKVFNTSTL